MPTKEACVWCAEQGKVRVDDPATVLYTLCEDHERHVKRLAHVHNEERRMDRAITKLVRKWEREQERDR